MGKKVFLEVPVNRMGLYGMTENVDARNDENMKIYEFSYEEKLLLWPLFYKFNDKFHILIADYEEDIQEYKELVAHMRAQVNRKDDYIDRLAKKAGI